MQATQFKPGEGVPLYIFDLDGTLALIEHRRYLVESRCRLCNGKSPEWEVNWCKECDNSGKQPGFKQDWKAFFAACRDDLPNWPVVGTFLQMYSIGCDVRIWSGRSDEVKQDTLLWLVRVTGLSLIQLDRILKMREASDFTPDEQLKKKWLNTMSKVERARLTAVFDDRQKVVDMWRSMGVACFQVAPGDF